MHESITAAINRNTEVSTALLRWLQSQAVSRPDLRDMEMRLTLLIENQHAAFLRGMTKRLDKAGAALADAVANNQPGCPEEPK